MIIKAIPPVPDTHRADTGAPWEARLGLLGWLAHGVPNTHRAAGGTVIVLDRAVANGFQIGFFPQVGPFLAYSPTLWWFPQVWRAAAVGATGIALLAEDPDPVALLWPSDWPQALEAFARLCAAWHAVALAPYSAAYAAALDDPASGRRIVASETDLDGSHVIPFSPLPETPSWLKTVLQSPLPV